MGSKNEHLAAAVTKFLQDDAAETVKRIDLEMHAKDTPVRVALAQAYDAGVRALVDAIIHEHTLKREKRDR